ncbi:hypothetical protein E2542_SST14775 [Spatholobus suberectus]|nr:hypothetical protein E2542_SST14775 [Spatholobus suberectus]
MQQKHNFRILFLDTLSLQRPRFCFGLKHALELSFSQPLVHLSRKLELSLVRLSRNLKLFLGQHSWVAKYVLAGQSLVGFDLFPFHYDFTGVLLNFPLMRKEKEKLP